MENQNTTTQSQLLVNRYNNLRANIQLEIVTIDKLIKDIIDDTTTEFSNKNEVIANCILSKRHLEDARMRLGKAIENHQGGGSIYDKKPDTENLQPRNYEEKDKAETENINK